MEPLTQISVRSQDIAHEVMVMAIDKSEAAAQNDFDAAKRVIDEHGMMFLLKNHS